MSSESNVGYGHNRSLVDKDRLYAKTAAAAAAAAAAAKEAAAYAASPAAAAVAAAAAHVPLTEEQFNAKYAHIKCDKCRDTAKKFGEPNYNKECTHKKGGAKKRSRRLRRGKSKSKFQRRGKSVKRRRRY